MTTTTNSSERNTTIRQTPSTYGNRNRNRNRNQTLYRNQSQSPTFHHSLFPSLILLGNTQYQ